MKRKSKMTKNAIWVFLSFTRRECPDGHSSHNDCAARRHAGKYGRKLPNDGWVKSAGQACDMQEVL